MEAHKKDKIKKSAGAACLKPQSDVRPLTAADGATLPADLAPSVVQLLLIALRAGWADPA